VTVVQPAGWSRPKGFASGLVANGFVFVSGQVGWDASARFAQGLVAQTRLALENVVTVLRAAGTSPDQIVRLTWYVTDKADYLANQRGIGAAYRETIGRHYPAMSVVEVAALVEDAALVEIEATAVVPHPSPPPNGAGHADD
jgi:enamine deaminase RidA (YjgF/YER057c/UK114 family)